MGSPTLPTSKNPNPRDEIIRLVSPFVSVLGYQIVHVEVQLQRQKVLRIFIDYLKPTSEKTIGIEDCVKVSKALDEPLDTIPEIEAIFHGNYELEVSSPGLDRPLRTPDDFTRFSGNDARIHVYRPLTSEELTNENYRLKNPKQKNFVGTLRGFENDRVLMAVPSDSAERIATVTIPLALISKANLEPKFDFERSDERE